MKKFSDKKVEIFKSFVEHKFVHAGALLEDLNNDELEEIKNDLSYLIGMINGISKLRINNKGFED